MSWNFAGLILVLWMTTDWAFNVQSTEMVTNGETIHHFAREKSVNRGYGETIHQIAREKSVDRD